MRSHLRFLISLIVYAFVTGTHSPPVLRADQPVLRADRPGLRAGQPGLRAGQPGVWPIEELQTRIPPHTILDRSGPIVSLTYQGQPIDGEPTDVFAFYASPTTLGKQGDGPAPGIILIHGGGGTAFSDWVWMWAQRGYAALAMDLSGRRPPAPSYDAAGNKIPDFHHPRNERTRLSNGGLDHTHAEKFQSIGGGVDDDWPFHAVANVIRAHTLLRSLPHVDPTRTAVTGISWGGYTTCLVASLDNRFKAAVPVYGCGFLHEGESVQKPQIDRLGERRGDWIAAYDPSSHLSKCSVPTFWVNGTHDIHYVLDSYAKSYSLVRGPKMFRIEPKMRHSHPAGWEPEEIGIYVDALLKGGVPLPQVGAMQIGDDQRVRASFQSASGARDAHLFFTKDSGLRSKRTWDSMPAEIAAGAIVAGPLPESANTYLMTLTDDRGAMVTTAVGMR